MSTSQDVTGSVAVDALPVSEAAAGKRKAHYLEEVPHSADKACYDRVYGQTVRQGRWLRENRVLKGLQDARSMAEGRGSPITFADADVISLSDSVKNIQDGMALIEEFDLYALPESAILSQAERELARVDSGVLPPHFLPLKLSGRGSFINPRGFVVDGGVFRRGSVMWLGESRDPVQVGGLLEWGWDYMVFGVNSFSCQSSWDHILVPSRLCYGCVSWRERLRSLRKCRFWRTLVSCVGREFQVGEIIEMPSVSRRSLSVSDIEKGNFPLDLD